MVVQDAISSSGSGPSLHQKLHMLRCLHMTGPLQVTFYFKNATSPKQAQTIARMHVISEHYWRDRNFNETTLEPPLGSGPYRVVETRF